MTIVKENAPHLRKKSSVTRMMVDVLIAILPTLVFAFVAYPKEASYTLAVSLFIMNAAEFVFVGLKNMMPKDDIKHPFKERFIYSYKGKYTLNNFLTATITAVIFTLIMPPLPIHQIYFVIVGALVGIIFGKLVFGGLGSNIFNPAAVGMIFAKLCFGTRYERVNTWFINNVDISTGGTILDKGDGLFSNMMDYSLKDMFIGQIPGTLGEVYKITIIVGLIYLLIRKSVDYRIVVSYLGSFVLFSLIAGATIWSVNPNIDPFYFTAYYLLSGGVLFGATFMLTDPATSPINPPSRYLYGVIAAIVTIFIRLFGSYPEGVGFSILFANMIACVLDHYEWSSSKFTKKKIIALICLIVIPIIIIVLILKFGGVIHG